MSQPLYEIKNELLSLQELIEETENPEESLAEAFNDTMDALEATFEEKAQNVVHFIKNVGSNLDSIDAEVKRLQAKKKAIVNKQEWFRSYLRDNMAASGITKIECPLFTISLSKAGKAVSVDDESLLPESAMKTVKSPDKTKIKKMLESGEEVNGASLIDAKSRLTIK